MLTYAGMAATLQHLAADVRGGLGAAQRRQDKDMSYAQAEESDARRMLERRRMLAYANVC